VADPFAYVLPFVATAEAKSFRAAAKALGVTPSAVSKAIAKLEADLGVELLRRTSRTVSTTTEGDAFLRRCRTAIDEVLAAREGASQSGKAPRGLLRVSLPPALARMVVAPALPQLTARHPLLEVELVCTDRFVRMTEEKIDVAIRIGKLEPQSALSRRLRVVRWMTVASPAYLARRPAPATPADLAAHELLAFVLPNGKRAPWRFAGDVTLEPSRGAIADDGLVLVELAAAGLGIVQAHDYMVASRVAKGELVPVLAEHAAEGPVVSVLARTSSAKTRAFLDFAAAALVRA
jgi:DNA-binding transcriptional LysR family regulator